MRPNGEAGAREHVGVGVRVGQRGVDDGEEHQGPEDDGDGARQAVPRHAVGRGGQSRRTGRAVGHGRRVGGEEVHAADQDRRQQHRARDVAPRVLGLLGQRRGRLEAGEGQQRADSPGEHAGHARVALGVRVVGGEDLQCVVAAGLDDERDRQREEHEDLDEAEPDAGPASRSARRGTPGSRRAGCRRR